MNEYIKSLYNKKRTYKKVCPFCNSMCSGVAGNDLFCKCNAKYYWKEKVWLNRNELIKRIYEKNFVGGALHIVLDDGDVADRHNSFGVAVNESEDAKNET